MNDSAAIGTLLGFFRILEDGDSPAFRFIGKLAFKIYQERQTLEEYMMYTHLILAAVFPIFIAAHSSLQQPPSAAKPIDYETEEDDDEINVQPIVEGLTPSDAIMFPVTAVFVLGGLYFFIKWMGDAKLLNKIMTVYFSALGVFGIAKLSKDSLDVVATFVFPDSWSNGTKTFYVNSDVSRQLAARFDKARSNISDEIVVDKTNPLPGYLSTIKFSSRITKALWSVRASFKKHWLLRCYIHGVCNSKSKLHLNDVIGFVVGVVAVIFYNTVRKAWWVTNLMAFGFSYGSIQMISPTTFTTGSLVLGGLFVYDVVMVFYTPMMATVATSLEVPIKLVFPGPKRGSMLGLGDVVLPGMMLALALRYDLYLHYLRKQRNPTLGFGNASKIITKEPYLNPKGLWGDRFWTRTAKTEDFAFADGARFSKVYFKAGVAGYVIGMVVTLYVCHAFQHAQPALLYLVPAVLIALWGTAYFRNELKMMWEYTEDAKWGWDDQSLGTNRQKNESSDSEKENSSSYFGSIAKGEKDKIVAKEKAAMKAASDHAHHVFLLSLSEPKHGLSKKVV
ncbi:hypothetical protein BDZ45DRAFT_669425 [Acephala macrosclerotiorum]|nr:hypothetical protein BDZ45DRAFT_669425 [Acephala macrosclerotiorum]